MCRQVLVTMSSSCEIAFSVSGAGLRPSSRRIATARVTAGTGRTRGPAVVVAASEGLVLIVVSRGGAKHTAGGQCPSQGVVQYCICTINRLY